MDSREEGKPKLEWMYKGSSDLLNREEYLLGRSIDKNFEQLDSQEKSEQQEKLFGVQVPKNHVEYECLPFSIREYKNLECNEQVDLQRKLMEDPLMAIKQKEMETRRKILENPVKLKEIHKILKNEKSKLVSSEKKKKGKTVKKVKKRKYSTSTTSSSSRDESSSDTETDEELDLDKLLAKKYKKVKHSLNDAIKKDLELDAMLQNFIEKKKKTKKSKKKFSRSESSRSDSSSARESNNRKKNYTKSRQHDSSTYFNKKGLEQGKKTKNDTSTSSSDKEHDRIATKTRNAKSFLNNHYNRNYEEDQRNRRNFDLYRKSLYEESYDRTDQRNRSPTFDKGSSKFSNDDRKFYSKSYKDMSRDNNHRNQRNERKDSQQSSSRPNYNLKSRSNEDKKKIIKITDEEREKRLKEMMLDAIKRDEERTNKVNKYRKDCEKEEAAHNNRGFDDQFAKNELKKALSTNNSVESRIKSKINNIQRSSNAMNSNFARK